MTARIEFTQDELNRMKELYESGLSTPKIGKKFGVGHVVIWKRLRDMGIEMRPTNWYKSRSTPLNAIQLGKDYLAGLTFEQLERKYAISSPSIYKHLDAMDISRRQSRHYQCNEHFFDDLALESPAYWLGFILADGSVRRRTPNRSGEILIVQSKRDIEHLERFKHDIEFNGPITLQTNGDVVQTRITSEHLYRRVLGLGIQPRKKYLDDYTFPSVPQCSVRHTIRGFVDGDGGLYINERLRINISSKSPNVLRNIKAILTANCPFGLGGYESKSRVTGVWTLGWSAKADCVWIARFLYGDCSVALLRKYDIAQQMMAMG